MQKLWTMGLPCGSLRKKPLDSIQSDCELFGAALNAIDVARGRVDVGIEQVPGLAKFFVPGLGQLRVKRNAFLTLNVFLGDDVPGVLVNNISGKKVEGTGGIALVAAAHSAFVTGSYFGDRGFDLYRHESGPDGL